MSKFIDIKGEKYNRWTVLSLDRIENKKAYWLCQCECGTKKVVSSSSLRCGTSKSCGCLVKENGIKTINGLSQTKLYRTYNNIKQRCYNLKMPFYKNYGGRNIKMCDEWLNDFIVFYNWSISNGYKDDLTIDRIDVNGDYEPNNCRWITKKEQYHNRTDNLYYIVDGKKRCLSELCKEYNMPYKTVSARLKRKNDIISALNTPIKTKYRNKLYKKKGE